MKRARKLNIIKELKKRRTRAKLFGVAARPRASIFRSNKFLYVQLINDREGRTFLSANAKKGVKEAIALGKKISELALKSGIKTVLFDRGAYKYHGQIKAVAEAMRSEGLEF